MRINLLTPSGIHLGQGPVEALNQDAMGGPILSAAYGPMKRIVEAEEGDERASFQPLACSRQLLSCGSALDAKATRAMQSW